MATRADTTAGPTGAPEGGAGPRLPRRAIAVMAVVLLLLHGLPWWLVVYAPHWSVAGFVVGTVLLAVAMVTFPLAMTRGHGRHHQDAAARLADTWLGVIWQLFAWSVPAAVALGLAVAAGVPQRPTARVIALAVLAVVAVLCCWGLREAMRTPRIKRRTVSLERLPAAFDGYRLVLIADTHYGPINRTRWSQRLVAAVNRLDADLLAHAGDLADGEVPQRSGQVAPLASATARDGRVYITGNHEYYSGAAGWVDHMAALGWTVLHNRHVEIRRGDDVLVIAGVDDATAAGAGVPGHGTNLAAALADAPTGGPVVLLAHQPKMVTAAVAAGIDLQLSGHTHGGQIWPFHLLVRADQKTLAGLSRPGARTQLYTSRGSGFWGPPFRVFAPSEITVLTLRTGGAAPGRSGV